MWISQRARSRPSITAEQLRIITLRMALKRAAVVCVFFPLLLPFHPLPLRLSRFSSGLKRWHFARRRERRRGDVEEEKDGGRLRREQGLYGYLNTFAINSRERVLEARSRPRNALILLPFLFSFCPRLSSPSPPRADCLYLWWRVAPFGRFEAR